MAQERMHDKFGNEIYLTEERWEHIVETHEEMAGYRDRIFTTLRTGRRRQDTLDPNKYKYSKRFTDLPEDFTHVVVVVKFTQREDPQGEDNHGITSPYL